MTVKQELRVLATIMRNVQKLTPAGREWLAARLADNELAEELLVARMTSVNA